MNLADEKWQRRNSRRGFVVATNQLIHDLQVEGDCSLRGSDAMRQKLCSILIIMPRDPFLLLMLLYPSLTFLLQSSMAESLSCRRRRLKQQQFFFSSEPQHLDLEYFCKYLGSSVLDRGSFIIELSKKKRCTMDECGFLAFIYWTAAAGQDDHNSAFLGICCCCCCVCTCYPRDLSFVFL